MNLFGTRFPTWLFVLYLLALSAILAWPCVAFGSAFAFDDPATNVPNTMRIVGIVLAYPLLPIAAVIGSYFTYRAAKKALAYGLAALALLPFAALFLMIAWSSIMNVLYALRPPQF